MAPLILITGASQGIGAAIAREFARQLPGAQLVLVARQAGKLQAVAEDCRVAGARAEALACDVTDEAAVVALATEVRARFGVVDVLVNNAGRFAPSELLTVSVKDFDAMIAANLRSQFLVTRAFAPAMADRGSGDIFNLSSIAGRQPYPGGAAYSVSKYAVTGFSQVLRAELRDRGVRVCTVYPGATVSPSWEGSDVPAEHMMPAEDLAGAFLAIYQLSRRTVVEEIVLRPQRGDP